MRGGRGQGMRCPAACPARQRAGTPGQASIGSGQLNHPASPRPCLSTNPGLPDASTGRCNCLPPAPRHSIQPTRAACGTCVAPTHTCRNHRLFELCGLRHADGLAVEERTTARHCKQGVMGREGSTQVSMVRGEQAGSTRREGSTAGVSKGACCKGSRAWGPCWDPRAPARKRHAACMSAVWHNHSMP